MMFGAMGNINVEVSHGSGTSVIEVYWYMGYRCSYKLFVGCRIKVLV